MQVGKYIMHDTVKQELTDYLNTTIGQHVLTVASAHQELIFRFLDKSFTSFFQLLRQFKQKFQGTFTAIEPKLNQHAYFKHYLTALNFFEDLEQINFERLGKEIDCILLESDNPNTPNYFLTLLTNLYLGSKSLKAAQEELRLNRPLMHLIKVITIYSEVNKEKIPYLLKLIDAVISEHNQELDTASPEKAVSNSKSVEDDKDRFSYDMGINQNRKTLFFKKFLLKFLASLDFTFHQKTLLLSMDQSLQSTSTYGILQKILLDHPQQFQAYINLKSARDGILTFKEMASASSSTTSLNAEGESSDNWQIDLPKPLPKNSIKLSVKDYVKANAEEDDDEILSPLATISSAAANPDIASSSLSAAPSYPSPDANTQKHKRKQPDTGHDDDDNSVPPGKRQRIIDLTKESASPIFLSTTPGGPGFFGHTYTAPANPASISSSSTTIDAPSSSTGTRYFSIGRQIGHLSRVSETTRAGRIIAEHTMEQLLEPFRQDMREKLIHIANTIAPHYKQFALIANSDIINVLDVLAVKVDNLKQTKNTTGLRGACYQWGKIEKAFDAAKITLASLQEKCRKQLRSNPEYANIVLEDTEGVLHFVYVLCDVISRLKKLPDSQPQPVQVTPASSSSVTTASPTVPLSPPPSLPMRWHQASIPAMPGGAPADSSLLRPAAAPVLLSPSNLSNTASSGASSSSGSTLPRPAASPAFLPPINLSNTVSSGTSSSSSSTLGTATPVPTAPQINASLTAQPQPQQCNTPNCLTHIASKKQATDEKKKAAELALQQKLAALGTPNETERQYFQLINLAYREALAQLPTISGNAVAKAAYFQEFKKIEKTIQQDFDKHVTPRNTG
jgi:hypothetical protein